MIKIKDGNPPQKDDTRKRDEDIKNVYEMELGKEAQIFSFNPNAWKTTFYNFLKKEQEGLEEEDKKKFCFRKVDSNNFIIWRIS